MRFVSTRDWLDVFDVFSARRGASRSGCCWGHELARRFCQPAGRAASGRVIGSPLPPGMSVRWRALRELHRQRPARRNYPMQRFEPAARMAEIGYHRNWRLAADTRR